MVSSRNTSYSITERVKSFKYAFNGIWLLVTTEINFIIHLICAIVVVALGLIYQISAHEWAFLALSVGFVLMAEAFNSAIEKLSDFIQPLRDPRIKAIKDISAGAVLISAITALAVGIAVFYKYLFH